MSMYTLFILAVLCVVAAMSGVVPFELSVVLAVCGAALIVVSNFKENK